MSDVVVVKRDGWKMLSMWALGVIAAVHGVLVVLPPEIAQARIPFVDMTWHELGVALMIAAAVLGAIGWLVRQDSLRAPTQPPTNFIQSLNYAPFAKGWRLDTNDAAQLRATQEQPADAPPPPKE